MSNPPFLVDSLPSNDNSLNLLPTTGSMIASAPFPPVKETDKILSISKSCWSTNISLKVPFITGLTKAVTPDPTWGRVISGKFITS